ncbi:lytic transglycosylase domain-containing protein [Microvirga sp. SRT01]|uniref:Lytic transglycosylase domain-containing protein n=1 Tax=Sphingomonas longa TaxID=2778730 RepID=A0ABS2D2R0_9SPHN|nr:MULTISPECIES: lytic transglycosylase domain-containing protein [Alphaproteobacteria]MBM6574848.1 lytic transglycosylase domain-containing protein [Sphingomonas sp. BT552]MBR7707900.1 lytic transglycosylase domain-containing protein [Microvirga sp. SRT01]
MIASLKSTVLLALFAGTAGLPQTQEQIERASVEAANRAAATAAGVTPASPQARPAIGNPALASAIAQWRALQQTDALPFDSYAGFVMAHPGWPGETANRRAAERQAQTAAPGNVVAFFRRYPPQSATGNVALARALAASGDIAGANAAAKAAWRMGSLSTQDEGLVLTQFAGALTPEDHDARMDALLWQDATGTAQRQLGYTSAAQRPIFAARLAFRTKAPDAAAISAATQALYANDPGYVADRATWLRNTLSPSVRPYLASRPALAQRPGNVEKWYEVLLVNARGAAADNQWQVAYDIARQVDDAYPAGTDVSKKPYGERDDYTSLVWLAGQTAMKQLGRPADAMPLFERYGRGSMAPQTRAKGFYWAGRAAEAAGLATQAAGYYAQAAGYRDQYYGQLALERTGQALVAPPAPPVPLIAQAQRDAFAARETVQAVRFLGQIGDWKDQTAFVRQIAADATTDTDHWLTADLSRQIARPDLAVMVGRSAMQNGLTEYSAAGFPTVPVPSGYEGQWTLIHAIARQESQFDRAAISGAGARGLMQLMPATAREQAGKMGLSYSPDQLTTDPNLSIMLGSSYFQRVFNNYGSYPLAIAAYNAGGGNVNKWLRQFGDPRTGAIEWVDWVEAIPYTETRNYVQRVLENAVVYDLMNPARAQSRGTTRLSWYLGKNRPG